MQLSSLPQNRRATRGTRLGSLAFALLLSVTLAAPGAQAAGLRQAASLTPQSPPDYPDREHVTNGCHISTITFLDRFLAAFPAERGEPLVITMLNADWVRRPHTIALLSWQGQWWCRDEYFGVFTLDRPVEAKPDMKQLVLRAETMLEKHVKTVMRTAVAAPRSAPPTSMSSEQRLREVAVVARTVPFSTTIFWVKCGSRELPVAFFRPTAQQIAVYDPLHGTCLAECSSRDDAKIVSLVASRLGYHVDGVHAELSSPLGTLVASVDLPNVASR